MATINLELAALEVPTHTSVKIRPARRQDGFKSPELLNLNDLDRDVVIALLNELSETVMQRWFEANDPK